MNDIVLLHLEKWKEGEGGGGLRGGDNGNQPSSSAAIGKLESRGNARVVGGVV